MSVTKVGNTLASLATLRNSNFQNGTKGRADILADLAGNSAFYAQWVDGILPVTGHEAYVLSPHNGIPGHTHSGAGDGTPFQGPVASAVFGYMPNASVLYKTAPFTWVDADHPRSNIVDGNIVGVIVPDCPPGGAYFHLDFVVTMVADVNAYGHIRIKSKDLNEVTANDIALTANTVTHTTLTGVMVRPGHINTIALKIDGSWDAATAEIYALGWSMNQTASAP